MVKKNLKQAAMAGGMEEVRTPGGVLLAYIVRKEFRGQKYNFPTPPDSPLQLGVNFYQTGESIKPHKHSPWNGTLHAAQEFVMISEGEVVLNLYDLEDRSVTDILLKEGDAVLLVAGGHGFHIQQNAKLTEVKLGPYHASGDKTHFSPKS